ncbi:sugar transferase [Lachnospiraceae bacterium 62-26]
MIGRRKKDGLACNNKFEQDNPLIGKKVVFIEDENSAKNADGVRGHLEIIGESVYNPSFYDRYVKRGLDILLSSMGLIILSPVYFGIALAIKIEDPGPVLFTQKRIGQNKRYFQLHKFRSMKTSTPQDVPTHMLEEPEQYITKVGKFLRDHSLDELPQIWDIFVGNMSVIGPRPSLWNQDVLIAERDKYNVNNIKPGLTGWAQVNGRDELTIPLKAKLDGEYVRKIGLRMDIKCFIKSISVFIHDNSIVEGNTSASKGICRHYDDGKKTEELIGRIGFSSPVIVDTTILKKVLITGAGSYIGKSFCVYAEKYYKNNFKIDVIDTLNPKWKDTDFSQYDVVYHVAGIAHADVGYVNDIKKEKYYAVNTDLAIEVCKIAKKAGVKEFVFMSSSIIYGEASRYGKEKLITKDTVPLPANFYGDSKLQADVAVRELADESFKVIVLRPPMIYGKGSKGNYPILAELARKLPVIPDISNHRSMLFVDNLCEFLCQILLVEIPDQAVVLIPQNGEWIKTVDMMKEIRKIAGKKVNKLRILNPFVLVGSKIPGKIGKIINKAFGNMVYDQKISRYEGINYQNIGLKESIERTEGGCIN